ncbi:MAG TPA: hypothetical protein VK968_19410 [Roseimicrobium sp.]|nr:hypothetical protein [Roseimicrobium sp.]
MRPTPTFTGNRIIVGDRSWSVPYPVADARRIGDRIVAVYDYMAGPKDGAFYNLEAFDDAGQKLWTAEHPGTGTTDAYVEFLCDDPLIMWNFACFRCKIDPENGKLLHAQFTK